MKGIYFIFLYFLLSIFSRINGQTILKQNLEQDSASKEYPVPPKNKNMLFYLQRTHNTNTIIYELNYNKDSSINEIEPVKVYWIRYADAGEVTPLSAVQKNFAYGVTSFLIDKEKKWFKITLKAYDKINIYIMNTQKDKNYHAYVKINGVLSEMINIFFKTEGGTFWSPNVVYVDLVGKDIHTQKTTIERFKPIK
jgi:hypothetical protein